MVSSAEHEAQDIAPRDEIKPVWKRPALRWQTVVAAVLFLVLAIWLGKMLVGYIAHNVEQNRSRVPSTPPGQTETLVTARDSHAGIGAPEVKPSTGEENGDGMGIEKRPGSNVGVSEEETSPSTSGIKPPENKVIVKLRATDRSWVSIYVDGEKAFSGIMNANEETQVSGYKVTLTIGNAGGILVTVDGKDLGYLGGFGEVIRNKVFTSGS